MARETFTRRQMLTFMAAPMAVAGSGMFTKAEAAASWNVFGAVDIGRVHFSIGVHSPHVRPYGRYPGYYYRTSHHITHKKHRCGSYCYHHNAYYYHHESCPLLGWHFARYGAPPAYYGPLYLRNEYRY